MLVYLICSTPKERVLHHNYSNVACKCSIINELRCQTKDKNWRIYLGSYWNRGSSWQISQADHRDGCHFSWTYHGRVLLISPGARKAWPLTTGWEGCFLCGPTPCHWLAERSGVVQWAALSQSVVKGRRGGWHLGCFPTCQKLTPPPPSGLWGRAAAALRTTGSQWGPTFYF